MKPRTASLRTLTATALLTLIALLAWDAAAEYWASSTGALVKDAREIVLMEVTGADSRGAIQGKVLKTWRGSPEVGASVSYAPWATSTTFPTGARALVICDRSLCPRAMALDRGGFYLLEAFEPGDGAAVLPGLLEERTLDALTAGREAPPLCLRARVAFVDDATTLQATGSFVLTTGDGTLTGPLAASSPAPLKASIRFGRALGQGVEGSTLVSLTSKGHVSLIGGAPTRAADGCYEATLTPAHPIARTPRELRSHLAGNPTTLVLGEGELLIERGPHKGRYPTTARVDEYGGLKLDTPLLAEGRVGLREHVDQRTRLGFSFTDSAYRPLLLLDLGDAQPRFPGAGDPVAFAEALKGGEASWPVQIEIDGPNTREVVGILRLRKR